ncbi:MAG: hypothetical protein ACYDAR_21015 [Thermomicrobiales bacterium]
MERPLLIFTAEDLVLALTLLVTVALAIALWRHGMGRTAVATPGVGDAANDGSDDALASAYDQLRALEAIEARTLRAIAEHRTRIQAMRQQLAHGTAEEHELLDTLERLTFAAIAAQHDRALNEALISKGEDA